MNEFRDSRKEYVEKKDLFAIGKFWIMPVPDSNVSAEVPIPIADALECRRRLGGLMPGSGCSG